MSSADTAPISSFQRDDMSIRARKARSKGSARRTLPRRPDPLGPTAERLAKADAPVKLGSGIYRAPPSIERMRDREQLAPGDAHLNAMMFMAAEKLERLALDAGLGGAIRGQDLTRIRGGTDGGLGDERTAHCLKEFRTACSLMGWFAAYPNRGAGRLTVAVVCDGMSVTEAASVYRPGGSNSARLGAGMDVLREGLFALAVHWRLIRG
jgi:hypothetical protein